MDAQYLFLWVSNSDSGVKNLGLLSPDSDRLRPLKTCTPTATPGPKSDYESDS